MNRNHDESLDRQALRTEEPLDREIGRALAGLPREKADASFTEQVLRRLDGTPSASRFRWQPVLAGAALATALVAILLAAGVLRPESRAPEAPGPALATTDHPDDPAASTQTPLPVARVAGSTEPYPETGDTGALLDELRREHARLERDLRDLRELARGSQVLYVGGDESLDFVLDLASEPEPAGGPGVRPASLQGPGPGGGLRFF